MKKEISMKTSWNGKDDLDLYVDANLIQEEAYEYEYKRIYRINAFRAKANDLDVDADELYGVENKDIPGNEEPEEIPVDKLLLDGMDWDFLGDRCILKGIRRPGDNTRRYMATRRVNTSRIKMVKTVGGCYNTINRGENGKTSAQNEDEWKSTIVATKKNDKSFVAAMDKKMDRRKSRHEGKTDCRTYVPEDTTFDFLSGLDLRGKIIAFADSDSKELREKFERYEYHEICYDLFLSAVDCVKEIRSADFSEAKIVAAQEWDDVYGVSTDIYSLGVFYETEDAVNAFLDNLVDVAGEDRYDTLDCVGVRIIPINGKHHIGGAVYID